MICWSPNLDHDITGDKFQRPTGYLLPPFTWGVQINYGISFIILDYSFPGCLRIPYIAATLWMGSYIVTCTSFTRWLYLSAKLYVVDSAVLVLMSISIPISFLSFSSTLYLFPSKADQSPIEEAKQSFDEVILPWQLFLLEEKLPGNKSWYQLSFSSVSNRPSRAHQKCEWAEPYSPNKKGTFIHQTCSRHVLQRDIT